MNNVEIIGNLVGQPQLKQAGSFELCQFSIAYNQRRKDGQKVPHFFECQAWGKSGQIIMEKNLQKGQKIIIGGSLAYSQWSDKDGKSRSQVKINVREAWPIQYIPQNQQSGNQSNYPPQQGYQNQSPNQGYQNMPANQPPQQGYPQNYPPQQGNQSNYPPQQGNQPPQQGNQNGYNNNDLW